MQYAKFARFAGLGALGATAGLIGLFLLFVFFTRPTPRGGINWSTALVTWLSVGVVIAILIAAHLAIGRALFLASRAKERELTRM